MSPTTTASARRGSPRWPRRCGTWRTWWWRRPTGSGARPRTRSAWIGRCASTSCEPGRLLDRRHAGRLRLPGAAAPGAAQPDLFVSGINNGFNLGSDVFYSGTVARRRRGGAARRAGDRRLARAAAAAGLRARGRLRARAGGRGAGAAGRAALPDGVAAERQRARRAPFAGYQVTPWASASTAIRSRCARICAGRAYYWIGGPEETGDDIPGSDCTPCAPGCFGDAAGARPDARAADRGDGRLEMGNSCTRPIDALRARARRPAGDDADFELARGAAMVDEQIVAPRHPATRACWRPWRRCRATASSTRPEPSAYEDRPLPIGYGQTISQPYMVARATELAAPRPSDRALEVGAGCGYQAAVLSRLCAAGLRGRDRPGAGRARGAIAGARSATTTSPSTRSTAAAAGREHAPYDVIIVSAGAPRIPALLLAQLADGGRLVIPVGGREEQVLAVVRREGDHYVISMTPAAATSISLGRFGVGAAMPRALARALAALCSPAAAAWTGAHRRPCIPHPGAGAGTSCSRGDAGEIAPARACRPRTCSRSTACAPANGDARSD